MVIGRGKSRKYTLKHKIFINFNEFFTFHFSIFTFFRTFAPANHWRDGRVVDYSGLENRRTERYRGFESLSLRKKRQPSGCLLSFRRGLRTPPHTTLTRFIHKIDDSTILSSNTYWHRLHILPSATP